MPEISEAKYLTMMEHEDVPHLDAETIRLIMAEVPPHQREARSKGIPSMGSGAIYPVPESDLIVDPFEIPNYWPRSAGMDVGWNRTAAVWAATDRNTQVSYLYSEYYKGECEPSVHSHGIRSRGDWIPIAIDPASGGRSQIDGRSLFDEYLDLGLDLIKADNTVETGLHVLWEMMASGRLKVFSNLQNWIMEFRLYRRDEKGKIVKQNDHLMDACRYWATTGVNFGKVKPKPIREIRRSDLNINKHTGY